MHTKLTRGLGAIAIGLTAINAYAAGDATLDDQVRNTLAQCRQLSTSCAQTTQKAPGILVFPNVVKADFIVGGSGGKGALVENGRITGYYNIGGPSAGLQAGIENTNQVYVFRTLAALADLKASPHWKAGTQAGVTLVSADANGQGVTGNVSTYIFDAKGLHAGVSLEAIDIWRAEPTKTQPKQQSY